MASLQQYLEGMLTDGTNTDTVILVGSEPDQKEIQAHSLILRRSEYFNASLSVGFQESLTNRIVIDDVKTSPFEHLIVALYTDKLPPAAGTKPEDLLDMLSLCERFIMPRTISDTILCALRQQAKWGVNVLTLIAKADELDLPEAIDICLATVTHDLQCVRSELAPFQAARRLESSAGVGVVHVAKARMAVARRVNALMQGATLPPLRVQTTSYPLYRERQVRSSDQCSQSSRQAYAEQAALCTTSDIEREYAKIKEDVARFNELRSMIFAELDSSIEQLLSAESDGKISAANIPREARCKQPEPCCSPFWLCLKGITEAVRDPMRKSRREALWWDTLAGR
mmetsp:Transcript_9748/g.20176  ORF Transcript_9748/g.20176 Transcript_9748/m.20176 type:complete len:341 (-) Transcript_9748:75-1097(-)